MAKNPNLNTKTAKITVFQPKTQDLTYKRAKNPNPNTKTAKNTVFQSKTQDLTY